MVAPKSANAPSLKETQQAFAKSILTGDTQPSGGLEHGERLHVYVDGFLARLYEAMEETYPTLYRVLGHERSVDLVDQYIRTFPPSRPNINLAGEQLSSYLLTHPTSKEHPYLPDLARFEWLLALAFHAAERSPISPGDLQNLSSEKWSDMVLEFQPHLYPFASSWPVYSLWKSRKNDDAEFTLPKSQAACRLILFRRGYELMTSEIDENEHSLLIQLKDGKTLGEVCENLPPRFDPNQLTTFFTKWMQLNLIVNVQVVKKLR